MTNVDFGVKFVHQVAFFSQVFSRGPGYVELAHRSNANLFRQTVEFMHNHFALRRNMTDKKAWVEILNALTENDLINQSNSPMSCWDAWYTATNATSDIVDVGVEFFIWMVAQEIPVEQMIHASFDLYKTEIQTWKSSLLQ
jgi:hypothetical protein